MGEETATKEKIKDRRIAPPLWRSPAFTNLITTIVGAFLLFLGGKFYAVMDTLSVIVGKKNEILLIVDSAQDYSRRMKINEDWITQVTKRVGELEKFKQRLEWERQWRNKYGAQEEDNP